MQLSAKAVFNDKTLHTHRLLIRADTDVPAEWLRRFRKNVVKITPMKTGALRRSIITQAGKGRAQVSWRVPYALAQHEGGHYVPRRVITNDQYNGGFGLIPAGYYKYSNYTTPGTGPRFGSIAFQKTNRELAAITRELGLTT